MTANGTNGVEKKEQHSLHDEHNVVLVLDYGSQYTQLICRRIREIGVFSMMFPGDASMVGVAGVVCDCPQHSTTAVSSSSRRQRRAVAAATTARYSSGIALTPPYATTCELFATPTQQP